MLRAHTGEGDTLGPTLSLRGLDNATYYRMVSGDPARNVDDTRLRQHAGTGQAAGRPPGDGCPSLLCRSGGDRRVSLRPGDDARPLAGDFTHVGARSVVVLAEEPDAAPRRRSSGAQTDALDRLANAAGIAREWWDLAGERHVVGPDTTGALLAAMGLTADSTSVALARLVDLADARERRPLLQGDSDPRCQQTMRCLPAPNASGTNSAGRCARWSGRDRRPAGGQSGTA